VQVYSQQDIGQVVQYLRQLRGKRQRDAAGQMGVSTTLLQRLETGSSGVRLQSALDALASLGLDLVLVPRDRQLSLQASADEHEMLSSPDDLHGR
jgi:transcriptional regulator with XRE-family HTH domain